MKLHFTVATLYEVEYPYSEDKDRRDEHFNAVCTEINANTEAVIGRAKVISRTVDSVEEKDEL